MGYACIACGAAWDPGHICQGMLDDIADKAVLARIRGEKTFNYDKNDYAVPDRLMFDLTSNPTMEERRQLAREKPVIAAEPNDDGTFHGVFIPKQPVKDEATQLVAIVCHDHHPTLFHALLCANTLGSQLIAQGMGEVRE